MGLNFKKRVKLGKGVGLNIGKKSLGISGGSKGVRVGANSRKGARASVGIPGTGLSYSVGGKAGKKRKKAASDSNGCVGCLGLILFFWVIGKLFGG